MPLFMGITGANEHFESVLNAELSSAVVFRYPPRDGVFTFG
jgi:hypothetical protein